MTARPTIPDEILSAYIDGELASDRAEAVLNAARDDPAIAERIAAFRSDKALLAAAYIHVGDDAIPDAWRSRIVAATAPNMIPLRQRAPRRKWPIVAMALAACLAIVTLTTLLRPTAPASAILAEANAARLGALTASARFAGDAPGDYAVREAALRQAVGLKLHIPDLSQQHWRLAELDTYAHAAALRYRSETGQMLTIYVRQSEGAPRFDLLKQGNIRTCIWQDEVVGTVMMGDMSAGQMMRVASAAYLALNS